MARVKNPFFSEEASGTVGGLTFKKNGYGQLVGRRSITPSLLTPKQSVHRGRIAIAQHAYDTLSAAERVMWDALAAPPMTGRNLFVGTYARWQMMNLAAFPYPVQDTSANFITDVDLNPVTSDPPLVVLSYTYNGDGRANINVFSLACYSNRETPKPRKLTFSYSDNISIAPFQYELKCAGPIVHTRIEVVSEVNGMVLETMLFRHKITWP